VKVYLASSFSLIPFVVQVAEYLEASGHTIAVKWWAKDGFGVYSEETHRQTCTDVPADLFYDKPHVRAIYQRDSAGVRACDALVIVAGGVPRKFNGANVEYGLALGHGKPCYSIGALENSALYYPVTRCKTLLELVDRLEAFIPYRAEDRKEGD